jgi:hypothetical protein
MQSDPSGGFAVPASGLNGLVDVPREWQQQELKCLLDIRRFLRFRYVHENLTAPAI